MLLIHYGKRELETIYIHRFRKEYLPFYRLFFEIGQFWIIGGVWMAYSVFGSDYIGTAYPKFFRYLWITAFFLGESMNWRCHLVLRDLRPIGTKTVWIPKVYFNNNNRDAALIIFHAQITFGK